MPEREQVGADAPLLSPSMLTGDDVSPLDPEPPDHVFGIPEGLRFGNQPVPAGKFGWSAPLQALEEA